ncbi:DnaB-like helicase C-terminal domain-containing protein [Zavarzinella formosa]|uniref:DnaB-like helicase C-terminal domain-containing protein n=1 Tax=Zavarzinella formosa TaxID=360055 RepID=UPI000311F1E1|nr:DnaB-like helicase C-terminal domain-containing protein [Zavarzinella formosa]
MIRNGAHVLKEVLHDIRKGQKPERYRLSAPFSHVPLGPGMMNVFAGPTGVGKTALVMQLVSDVLANNSGVSAFVANVEMDPKQLTRRMMASASGIAGTKIDGNDLTKAEKATLMQAAKGLQPVASRITFWDGEFSLSAMVGDIEATDPKILVIDYVQRLTVGTDETKGDEERTRLNDLMNKLREFAKRGVCVIILAAVSRQKGSRGSNYEGLGLASMRGSSELEYATDNVFIMEARKEGTNIIDLKHEKNRSGPLKTVALKFHGETYGFVSADILTSGMGKAGSTTGKPIGSKSVRAKKGLVTNGQAPNPK